MRFYVSIIELADRYHPEEGGYYAYDRIVLDSVNHLDPFEALRCLVNGVFEVIRDGWNISRASHLTTHPSQWLKYNSRINWWEEQLPCVTLENSYSHDKVQVFISLDEPRTEYHEYC